MEKAKQVITSFVSRDGKHNTTVDEDVRSSVTDEHVYPHQHEEVMTGLDKEIHQHHHHTVVQPIKVTEKHAEKHTHHSLPVEHKVFNHENEQELRDTLAQDMSKYKSNLVTHETTNSSSAAPVAVSEHVHHHVHEHIQPVVQKETIIPETVHTTRTIHETHHVKAVHHGTSILPPKTMEEWKNEGGVLGGRAAHALSETAGCPAPYKPDLQSEQMSADKNMHSSILKNKDAPATASNLGGTTAIEAQTTQKLPLKASDSRSDARSSTSSSSSDAGMAGDRRTGKTLLESGQKHYALGSGAAAAGMTSGAHHSASAPRAETAHVKERQKPFVDSLGVRQGPQTEHKRRSSLVDKLNPFKSTDGVKFGHIKN
jgi:hypothetical protein